MKPSRNRSKPSAALATLSAMMTLSAGCASGTSALSRSDLCVLWPEAPPVGYYAGDGPQETSEKDLLIARWEAYCAPPQ